MVYHALLFIVSHGEPVCRIDDAAWFLALVSIYMDFQNQEMMLTSGCSLVKLVQDSTTLTIGSGEHARSPTVSNLLLIIRTTKYQRFD